MAGSLLIKRQSMKTLIILLALTLPAMAQQGYTPRIIPLIGKDGQQIGTATLSGLHIYLRNMQNEIFAQIVVERDGSRTMYDANGKVLDHVPAPEPKKD
jgi:hypothetical protein